MTKEQSRLFVQASISNVVHTVSPYRNSAAILRTSFFRSRREGLYSVFLRSNKNLGDRIKDPFNSVIRILN